MPFLIISLSKFLENLLSGATLPILNRTSARQRRTERGCGAAPIFVPSPARVGHPTVRVAGALPNPQPEMPTPQLCTLETAPCTLEAAAASPLFAYQ